MKQRIALILVCFGLLLANPVQSDEGGGNFQQVCALAINAKIMQTDNLGNIYLVNNTNQLYKLNKNGKLLSTLNYNYTGNITQIDVTNPLEIYLFYRELNKVVFLDNNLAYRGEIGLQKSNIVLAASAARTFDNNIWVFDAGDLQLKKINKTGEVEQESGNIKQYINDKIAVTQIVDNNDRVFVVDSINGIMVFDLFATYIKTIPIKQVPEVKVQDKSLFYLKGGRMNRYNWQTAQMASFSLPDSSRVLRMSIEKERIFLLKPDSVYCYSY